MTLKKETILDNNIITEYNSSNLKQSEYNKENQELIMEFKKRGKYLYYKVPLLIFTKLRTAESSGAYFSKNIAKKYKFKKL